MEGKLVILILLIVWIFIVVKLFVVCCFRVLFFGKFGVLLVSKLVVFLRLILKINFLVVGLKEEFFFIIKNLLLLL